jgi:hypothetical protein
VVGCMLTPGFSKSCSESQKTHFMSNIYIYIYIYLNRAVCEIMWKKYGIFRQVTNDDIKGPMRIMCWITKATHTYSECVILLFFHSKNGYAKSLQIYVTFTLLFLLQFTNKHALLINCVSL